MMGYLEIRAPFNRLNVESAEDLWSTFMDYRDHSINTPVIEPRIFNAKEGLRHGDLNKPRPLTLNGFCNYIGVHPGTWDRWKTEELGAQEDQDHCRFFYDVMMQIESIVYDDQYQGAAVNIFNASVVSRKLGLAEKSEITGTGGGPIQTEELSARERIAGRLAGLAAGSDSESDPGGAD